MLAFLAFVHQRFGIALLLLAGLLGLWGGLQFLTRRQVSGGFRSTFLLMAGLTAVQGLAGLGALLTGGHPKELLHLVYGAFAVLFLPGVYTWATTRKADTEAAVLTAACWIVLIAYIRGVTTGQ